MSLSDVIEMFLPSLNSLVMSTKGFTSAVATVFKNPCSGLSSLFLDALSIQDYEKLNRKICNGELAGLITLGLSMDIAVSRTFVRPLAELSLTQLTLNNVGFVHGYGCR